jgi:hypothetical protein
MRWQGKRRKRAYIWSWESWFAWYPVKTISSEWVWLERVDRCSFMAPWIPSDAPFVGRYCFRRLGT